MRRLPSTALCSLLWGCASPAADAVPTVAPVAAPSEPRPEVLDVRTVVDLHYVSEVALSPDGQSIAYVLRVPPDALDGPAGRRSVLWVVPTDGGRGRAYTSPGASAHSAAWSPDGRRIAFLSRPPGASHTTIYAVPSEGGEPERLTQTAVDVDVQRLAWSPDGKRMAFIADQRPTEERERDLEAGRDWIVGDVEGTFGRLWVMDLRSGQAQPISPRDTHIEQVSWAPDGKRLVVQAGDRADADGVMMYTGLFTLPVAGGSLTPLCPTAGKLGHVAWSPDGETIAFLGATDIHDPTAGVLHVVPAGGGQARPLTREYAGTGEWFRWVDDGELLMLADQGTRTAVHRVALDGTMSASTVTEPVCLSADADDRGQAIACAGEHATHPREVFAGPPDALRRLTDSNPVLHGIPLGERRIERWTAADGLTIEGVVTLPVGFEPGTRYPLAVLVHGGPEGVSLDGWNTRSGYPTQLFATRGYVVLEPNYRGSKGRGVDFGKADHGDLGGKEFEDVLAGIDHLVAQGLVDGDRVGMGGWSYGGYFSGLAATRYSERFAAAMVGAAIIDWISFTGTSEIEHENSLVHWRLWPYEHAQLAWERSPMAHAQGSTTATLVVHGLQDTRVPPGQGKELYRALRHAGATTELVLYPREGHGLHERAHELHFAQRWLDWFDLHVKHADGGTPSDAPSEAASIEGSAAPTG